MSSFRNFTPEELSALTPWRLPSVGEPDPSEEADGEAASVTVIEEEVETAPRLTVEEIEAMQQQAHDEASARGLEEGRERGYREGYEAGLREALAKAQEDLNERGARMDALVYALNEPLRAVNDEVVDELAALATALARQLIRRELRTELGQIVAVVREAMAALPSSSRKISLHLNPEDAELVRQTLALDDEGQTWRLVEDPLLTRGGCLVNTENTRIDASVEKRLAAVIARAFGGEREGDAA